MVRRITMDEASANFKDIVERALDNGDSLEIERNGRVIATVAPTPVPKVKVPLGQLVRELHAMWPDEDFAKDVQSAIDSQGMTDLKDPWEKYGDASRHQHTDPARESTPDRPAHTSG